MRRARSTSMREPQSRESAAAVETDWQRRRDAWGRTPAGRLRTTLPRPCRARHALRDARRGGGAHRLLVLVAHSGSPKTARANYAQKTLPLWQGAKAESAQRACLSAAAGCGQRGRARSERHERRDGRAREAAQAPRPRVCRVDDELQASKAFTPCETDGQRRAKEGGDQSF